MAVFLNSVQLMTSPKAASWAALCPVYIWPCDSANTTWYPSGIELPHKFTCSVALYVRQYDFAFGYAGTCSHDVALQVNTHMKLPDGPGTQIGFPAHDRRKAQFITMDHSILVHLTHKAFNAA